VDGVVGLQCKYKHLGEFVEDVLTFNTKLTPEQRELMEAYITEVMQKNHEFVEGKLKDFNFTVARNARVAKSDDEKQEYERDKLLSEMKEDYESKIALLEDMLAQKEKKAEEELDKEKQQLNEVMEKRFQKMQLDIEMLQQ